MIKKRAEYADKYINLAPEGDERAEELVESGEEIFLSAMLDMKSYGAVEREKELLAFSKNCKPKNFKLYFFVNYKLAKVRKKRAESCDTSNLAGTNVAIGFITNARKTLGLGEKQAEQNSYEHEKDE